MKNHSNKFVELVLEAKQKVKETDVHAVKQKLERKHSFYLIDVREESEWANGHLPNAIHLSKGILERDIEKVIPNPNAEIVLYCGGGHRSVLCAVNLQKMGYTQVESMDGGFRGWLAAGYQLAEEDE